MSELTSIQKKVIGAGAEKYLPFALSKLRQMAAGNPEGYASRAWHTDDGVTILAEFWPPSAGAVTLTGSGFLSVGTLVQKGPYVLTGSSSLKKDFREFATDIGTEPWVNWVLPWINPINRNEALLVIINKDNRFTLHKVTGNGTATQLMQADYASAPTGSAAVVGGCYVGRTGDDGVDRLLVFRSVYDDEYYRMLMACSDDRGKTWTSYWPGVSIHQGGKHQYWSLKGYLGNGVILVMTLYAEQDGYSYKAASEPFMMRSADHGNWWSACPLPGMFDWAISESTGELDLGYLIIAIEESVVVPMGGGMAMLLMEVRDDYGWSCWIYVSSDDGLTWGSGKRLAGYFSTPIALGPGGVAVVVAPITDETASYGFSLAITGDYGASWQFRALPCPKSELHILPDPTLIARPPLVANGSTVDIDKVRITVPFYGTDDDGIGGYYAWITNDGGTTWERGGRIAETALRPDVMDYLDDQLDYERIAALSLSGSIAFPTLYANNGEPLS